MNYGLSPELTALQARIREFIEQEVIPLEQDPRQTPHGPSRELCLELQANAMHQAFPDPSFH